jgi:AraC-like DNA-binding protein
MTSLPSHVGNAIRTSALGSGDQEIPRAQLRAIKPTLERIFAKDTDTGSGRSVPGTWYRLQEIAAHLGVHYATVSRKLKKLEHRNY